jgi:hypothetical protein
MAGGHERAAVHHEQAIDQWIQPAMLCAVQGLASWPELARGAGGGRGLVEDELRVVVGPAGQIRQHVPHPLRLEVRVLHQPTHARTHARASARALTHQSTCARTHTHIVHGRVWASAVKLAMIRRMEQ